MDQRPADSMGIDDLAARIEVEADTISFAYELGRYPIETYASVISDPKEARFYFLLAAAAKILEPKHALDLGTCSGMSAIAMGKYALHVTTVDVTWAMLFPGLFPWFGREVPVQLERDNITAKLVKPDDIPCAKWKNKPVEELKSCDLIFVDIDPHDGKTEYRIHTELMAQCWQGHVFYDDINQPAMSKFWKKISECPKVEFSRGNVGGTIGLVKYG